MRLDSFNLKSNNFDLIRLLAAILVIYGHSKAVTQSGPNDFFLDIIGFRFIGGVSVAIFFFISGFLVTSSALNSTLKYYISSRILRIYPGLLLMLMVSILIIGPIFTTSSNYWSFETVKYFLVNFSTLSTEHFLPGVFEQNPNHGVNGSLWSISLEIKMYLITILLFLLPKNNKYIFNLSFFSLIFIGKFTHFFEIFFHPDHIEFIFFYLIGAFAYINRNSIVINAPLFFLFLMMSGPFLHQKDFVYFYPILISYSVLLFSYGFPKINLPNWKGLNWIKGDYSYGIYLFGWPALQINYILFPGISNFTLSIFSIIFALLYAFFSYKFIEKPFLSCKSFFK